MAININLTDTQRDALETFGNIINLDGDDAVVTPHRLEVSAATMRALQQRGVVVSTSRGRGWQLTARGVVVANWIVAEREARSAYGMIRFVRTHGEETVQFYEHQLAHYEMLVRRYERQWEQAAQ